MSLMDVIKSEVTRHLRDTVIPTIIEVIDIDEEFYDSCDCCGVGGAEVNVTYYDTADPFVPVNQTFRGSLQVLLEKIDDHSREGS